MIVNKYELYANDTDMLQIQLNDDLSGAVCFYVQSNGYTGYGPIYLTEQSRMDVIAQLTIMQDSLTGTVVLKDAESVDYFFELKFVGRDLFASGCIGDYNFYRLQFRCQVDQTILQRLLSVMKKLK